MLCGKAGEKSASIIPQTIAKRTFSTTCDLARFCRSLDVRYRVLDQPAVFHIHKTFDELSKAAQLTFRAELNRPVHNLCEAVPKLAPILENSGIAKSTIAEIRTALSWLAFLWQCFDACPPNVGSDEGRNDSDKLTWSDDDFYGL